MNSVLGLGAVGFTSGVQGGMFGADSRTGAEVRSGRGEIPECAQALVLERRRSIAREDTRHSSEQPPLLGDENSSPAMAVTRPM